MTSLGSGTCSVVIYEGVPGDGPVELGVHPEPRPLPVSQSNFATIFDLSPSGEARLQGPTKAFPPETHSFSRRWILNIFSLFLPSAANNTPSDGALCFLLFNVLTALGILSPFEETKPGMFPPMDLGVLISPRWKKTQDRKARSSGICVPAPDCPFLTNPFCTKPYLSVVCL